jgi:phosphoglucosamine mutase
MKKCKHFGTDGIRGIVGKDFNPELVTRIANATAVFVEKRPANILIGWDTRASCDFVVEIFAGILSGYGINVVKIGVVPTCALLFLTNKQNADLGIMVSASHNDSRYNGIKFASPSGEKLTDAQVVELDKLVARNAKPKTHVTAKDLGKIMEDSKAIKLWQKYLAKKFPSFPGAKKIKVALDGAHGSGADCATEVLRSFGFPVTTFNNKPDGFNINEGCGATYAAFLNNAMKQGGFNIGFALDGDADRCVFFDEHGSTIHGDMIIYLLAKYFKDRGELSKNKVVGTILTNLGIEKALNNQGIKLLRTDVGDVNVCRATKKEGLVMGGEPNGHMIFPKIWNTDDGLVLALMVLSMLEASGKSMSELCADVEVYPQISINVDATPEQKKQLFANTDFKTFVKTAQAKHKDFRVIVRPSGTENIVRVTVEGAKKPDCEKICQDIATQVKKTLK